MSGRQGDPGTGAAPSGNEIAIVAMHGRFPGSAGVERLWENLCAGVDAAVELSEEQLRAAGVSAALLADPRYVRLAQLLPEADLFDAVHFDYSARESELIDPQQRLFLECAWELLERAGYDSARYAGRIGVVASVSRNGYHEAVLHSLADPIATFEAHISNDKDYVATRVAYKLDLRGPCLTVQTACSSSLVAAHVACQQLLDGEADMMIAGGATVRVPQETGYLCKEGFILSPDGRCRAFDAAADGCNAGNGVAMVLLKRLADAVADGDEVQAVIRGSAINNDGAAKAGFTAPSVEGQAAVIAEALTVAAVHPESIGYVEAHGTGTRIGDPIEAAALTQVFRASTAARQFCALGSIKANVGHLDAAAGAAGLIKAALVVRHGLIPPSPYFREPNPEARLPASPFFVNRELLPWPGEGRPRRAAVSAFGIGGTNAHAVLEQPPARPPAQPSRRRLQLLPLSAKTAPALAATASRLAAHLAAAPLALADAGELADVAYTLQVGRRRLPHRLALLAGDRAEAIAALGGAAPERAMAADEDASAVPVAFLFPGGGVQYPGMAGELYDTEPVFRETIDRCAELLRAESGLDLRALLAPPGEDAEGAARRMRRTSVALPALFAVEIALARLWLSWGVRPWAVLGHSLGEYAAACVAEVFSLEDALRVVTLRGRLFESLPAGAMLGVPLTEPDLAPFLGGELSVAAVNAPGQCVVAGPDGAVEALAARLAARGLEARRLHIDVAAHSPMVDPILGEFGRLLATIPLRPPTCPMLSNVTGTWATAAELTDPAYWVQHLRRTVRFGDQLAALMETPRQVLLEMGPGRTLGSFALAAPGRAPATSAATSLRHPRDPHSDGEALLAALGRLWTWGVDVDWAGVHAGERRHRVLLPTYPFARQRYRIEPRPAGAGFPSTPPAGRAELADWFQLPAWRLAAPPPAPAGSGRRRRILLFAATAAASGGERLAADLAALGHEVLEAEPGARFGRLGERRFSVRPEAAEDLGRLLGELAAGGGLPDTIVVDLRAAPAGGGGPIAGDGDGAPPWPRGRGLLALAQALAALGDPAAIADPGKHRDGHEIELTVVAGGLHDVSGDEPLDPLAAPLLALCQAIGRELPGIACRSLDLAAAPAGAPAARRIDAQLLAEIAAGGTETVVAYRGERRWLPDLVPLRLTGERAAPLRSGGTYLIIGGSGRLGLAFAHRLAAGWQPNLALLARRLPTPAAAARIEELRGLGAQVAVLQADATDAAALGAAVAAVRARFGGLHGVIDAAAAGGDEAERQLRDLTWEACEELWEARMRGLLALEAALDGLDLDLCILTCCLDAAAGKPGGALARGAELLAESFASRHNRGSGQPWTALTWSCWESAAEEAGAAAPGRGGERAILDEEGGIAVERALAAAPGGHLLISPFPLASRFAARPGAPAAAAPPAELHARPGISSRYAPPRGALEAAVARIFEELLGVRPVGIYDSFFELGGSSLAAARALARLREEMGFTPPLSELFGAPTVAGLAELLRAAEGGRPAVESGGASGPAAARHPGAAAAVLESGEI